MDIAQGLPVYNMVGLPGSEVRESRERVRTAIHNSGYHIPYGRITVNLSPANRRKTGTGFDLGIAIGLLVSMGQVSFADSGKCLIIGELGLNGEVHCVNGILPILMMAKKTGFTSCILPSDNFLEAELVFCRMIQNINQEINNNINNTYNNYYSLNYRIITFLN